MTTMTQDPLIEALANNRSLDPVIAALQDDLERRARANRYRELRAKHYPIAARYAWQWAKGHDYHDGLDDLDWGDASWPVVREVELRRGGFDIHIEARVDEDPYRGDWTFTDDAPDAQWHKLYECEPGEEKPDGKFRYLAPGEGTGDGYADWYEGARQQGRSKHDADCYARRMIRRLVAFYSDDDFMSLGIIVTASRAGIELGDGACWGCEQDMDGQRDTEELIVEFLRDHDLIGEAIHSAERKLNQLRS